MDIVYEALKKTGMTDNEAHEVASKINRQDDLATKADLAELKAEIFKMQFVIAFLIIAAVGLIIKFV